MRVEEAKDILNSIITNYSKENMFEDEQSNDVYVILVEVEHFSNDTFTEEEEFQIQELSKFIFEHEKSGKYASYLANKCFDHNKFDLALYYYELAIQYGYLPAYKFVGDLYYDGNLSSGKDLKKAFDYYILASKTKKIGDGSWENPVVDVRNEAKIILADMYKNGEYVEKNYEKYLALINEVYEEVINNEDEDVIKSKIYKEKALISLEQNDEENYINYLFESLYSTLDFYFKSFLFDSLYEIDKTISTIYNRIGIEESDIDFPEMFYFVKKPCKIKFTLDNKNHYIESLMENGSIVINLDGQWFRDAEEMIDGAIINGKEMKFNIINIDTWEVLEWKN